MFCYAQSTRTVISERNIFYNRNAINARKKISIMERLVYCQSEGGGGGGGEGERKRIKAKTDRKREHTNYHHLPEMLISSKHSNI